MIFWVSTLSMQESKFMVGLNNFGIHQKSPQYSKIQDPGLDFAE
jgi:hypothetical protein